MLHVMVVELVNSTTAQRGVQWAAAYL